MVYRSRTEDEAIIFVVCRNCVHLFQNMQVIINFFKSWVSCFTLYYKFMTCPGSPACPWISPLLCFWHCHCHWKTCQFRGRRTKKRKKWKSLITGGFQGNLISQINATSVTKSWNAVSSFCTVCLLTIFCPSQKVVLDPFWCNFVLLSPGIIGILPCCQPSFSPIQVEYAGCICLSLQTTRPQLERCA